MPSTRTVKSGAPSSPRFSLPIIANVRRNMQDTESNIKEVTERIESAIKDMVVRYVA